MKDREFTGFLKKVIGKLPKNIETYRTAFTHPSHNHWQNYQRLEFLGDAVLNLAISSILYRQNEGFKEGLLTKERMTMVRTEILARVSETMGLNQWILLGKSEEADKGREKPSILADVFEAFVAAMFLDRGFDFVELWIHRHVPTFQTLKDDIHDHKSALQELLQSRKQSLPEYRLVREEGEAHKKTFYVELFINNALAAEGEGRTKRTAEQDAAMKALTALNLNDQH